MLPIISGLVKSTNSRMNATCYMISSQPRRPAAPNHVKVFTVLKCPVQVKPISITMWGNPEIAS